MAAVQDEKMTSPLSLNPSNKTTLSIRGWHRAEVDQILEDFYRLYSLPDSSSLRIEAKSNDIFVLTFPQDIQPKLFLFLVNYIQYPKNFDLTHRFIGVLGRVVLTPGFGAPDSALVGKLTVIYVPANDTEYDLVYARVESGTTYRIPFTTLSWKMTEDSRMPAAVAGL
jgi:hypothetical protein